MSLLSSFFDILSQFAFAMIVAIFAENTIFTRALGTSTAMYITKNKLSFFLFGIAMSIISVVCSILAYITLPIYQRLPFKSAFMPLFYVLMISIVYFVSIIVASKTSVKTQLKPMFSMCTFNCAILGAIFLMVSEKGNIGYFIGFGLGTGVGFIVATSLLSIAHNRLNGANVSKSFKGTPIIFIYLGIISLAFYALVGHELAF